MSTTVKVGDVITDPEAIRRLQPGTRVRLRDREVNTIGRIDGEFVFWEGSSGHHDWAFMVGSSCARSGIEILALPEPAERSSEQPRQVPYVERDPDKLRVGMRVAHHLDDPKHRYPLTLTSRRSGGGWNAVAHGGYVLAVSVNAITGGRTTVVALPESEAPEQPEPQAGDVWEFHTAGESPVGIVYEPGAQTVIRSEHVLFFTHHDSRKFLRTHARLVERDGKPWPHVGVTITGGKTTCPGTLTVQRVPEAPKPAVRQHRMDRYAGGCLHCGQPIGQATPSVCPGDTDWRTQEDRETAMLTANDDLRDCVRARLNETPLADAAMRAGDPMSYSGAASMVGQIVKRGGRVL